MALMNALHFGDQRNIHGRSMDTMAAAMSNKPIRIIVPTTSFQRYVMRNIPIFSGYHLHIAKVTSAAVPQKDICAHL
jgi:hypothetical protein